MEINQESIYQYRRRRLLAVLVFYIYGFGWKSHRDNRKLSGTMKGNGLGMELIVEKAIIGVDKLEKSVPSENML